MARRGDMQEEQERGYDPRMGNTEDLPGIAKRLVAALFSQPVVASCCELSRPEAWRQPHVTEWECGRDWSGRCVV